MVEFSHWVGCHLGVGSFMMGLVVLAAGTSIPDTLSSVMVAKRGEPAGLQIGAPAPIKPSLRFLKKMRKKS